MASLRLKKINRLVQRTFGEVLQREAELPTAALVTVSRVETTANLKSAQIWLSVFPDEQADVLLEQLKKQLYTLQGALNRALDLYPLPRIILRLDHGAAHAETINRKLKELD